MMKPQCQEGTPGRCLPAPSSPAARHYPIIYPAVAPVLRELDAGKLALPRRGEGAFNGGCAGSPHRSPFDMHPERPGLSSVGGESRRPLLTHVG